MGHIAIRLNPQKMSNPDLDVRYALPDLVKEHTGGRVQDDGYDYGNDGDNALIIFLSCSSPATEVHDVIRILREHTICENAILESAVIGISEDAHKFEIVYPDQGGTFAIGER